MSYPLDVGDGTYVYAGPEPRPFDTTGPIGSSPNPNPIYSIRYILPPICVKCSRYPLCTAGVMATLEDCEKNLKLSPEKRVVIRVKKRKGD